MKIAIVGYGRMGHTLEALAPEMGCEVVACLDHDAHLDRDSLAGAQVAIEFTVPESAPSVIRTLAALGVDVVSGTTGWQDQLESVSRAVDAAGTGLLHAPNFSIGVALFRRMVRDAAQIVDGVEDYDVHLHETHHHAKVDHPSGTAVALADDILSQSTRKTSWAEYPPADSPGSAGSLGSTGPADPVDPAVLGISVAREGHVPGTHIVTFDGPDDRIELRHDARSRNGFARGALTSAKWLHGRTGVFTLDDLLDAQLGER